MRYTEYDSELGRFVVPWLLKEDGFGKFGFFVIKRMSPNVYNGRDEWVRPSEEPELVYGEVIDRLAELENEEELRNTTELKLTVDDETAKKLKVAKQPITEGEVKTAATPRIEPAVTSRAAEIESKLERVEKDLSELQEGVVNHRDAISELFYDVEWMKDDVKKLQDDQNRTAKWAAAAALSLMIMGMTLVISSLVQLLL